MTEAAGFSTKDVANIAAVAGDCLRSRKIDVRTARRIIKTAGRALRAFRAKSRTAQADLAARERYDREISSAVAQLREAEKMLAGLAAPPAIDAEDPGDCEATKNSWAQNAKRSAPD